MQFMLLLRIPAVQGILTTMRALTSLSLSVGACVVVVVVVCP
jgi:hypothetical protein